MNLKDEKLVSVVTECEIILSRSTAIVPSVFKANSAGLLAPHEDNFISNSYSNAGNTQQQSQAGPFLVSILWLFLVTSSDY